MSSLVSDFIINPVARTVRQLSSSPFSAGAASPEPARPFSHDYTAVGNGHAVSECNAVPIPLPSLGRFARSPDIALGARSPPLMIPQRRAATAPVELDPSRPSTAPPAAPLIVEMERHEHPEVSDVENTIGGQAAPGSHVATDDGTQAAQNRAHPLPADDGMKHLRQRILSIQSSSITHDQKRYLMQQLLTESYANAKRAKTVAQGKVEIRPRQNGYLEDPETPSASTSREIGFGVTALETIKSWTGLDGKAAIHASDEDRLPTYVPTSATVVVDDEEDSDDVGNVEGAALVLGCNHYRRNVKMQCVTCEKWYTCRLCHDEVEEHTLPRRLTKHMLCMLCGHPQKVSDTCVNCNESAARYYCSICKLWSDDVHKPIYHCDECGICRVGHGLDKDFFHCKTCRACISITQTNDHKCIERATDADCPICGENMFASPKTVIFMECGHSIHRACFNQYMASSYKCPICSKSIVNMEALFTNLANHIQEQPMPEEFRNVRSVVLCNDCSAKSSTQFHFLGLRCQICKSFNTAELDRSPMPGEGMVQMHMRHIA
ncbi:hypothetical protein VSDG_01064 [Cytospora chrysosperma]|uniref:RING-type domain-containing protein n=1 Tax=Cytospora chrysosperma TaxID=252740 RepID=A0A423WL77_CYTCH|nr:hypothetical protein VSDG_01064 [Valsa sordida]